MIRKSTTALAAGLALAAISLSACGEKQEPAEGQKTTQSFDLALDFYVNPDHAGIYTALQRGYFARAGLDVKPRVPSDPSAPIKEVAAGRADLAVSYEPEVLLAREQGLDVVAVAALVQQPLTALISLPAAAITEPADLRGKTVATAGIPYQRDYLDAILGKAGVSPSEVTITDVGFNLLPAILSGKADAILGGFQNIEGVDLQQRGAAPTIVNVRDLGVPNYDELVLVANQDVVSSDPETIRLFIEALKRGTRDAAADPAAAAKIILEAGDGLDPKLTRAELDATLPLLQPAAGHPYGYMDPSQWEAFAGFMAANGSLPQVPPIDETITNALLEPPHDG